MMEFTILVPVWLPLLIGTLWIGSSMIRQQQITQTARDLASMYSRGVNFSTNGDTAEGGVLAQITAPLGSLDATTGNGVIIFSTITYAGNSFCASANTSTTTYGSLSPLSHTGNCSNYGNFVFTQQYTQGKSSLMSTGSNFGTPTGPLDANTFSILPSDSVSVSGNKSKFNLITPVPAEAGSDGYQSGQPIYVVEVYFQHTGLSGLTSGGDYAYAVF